MSEPNTSEPLHSSWSRQAIFVSGLPHVKDGKLRGLAVTSEKRSPLAPDLATVADALPGFESVTWFGL